MTSVDDLKRRRARDAGQVASAPGLNQDQVPQVGWVGLGARFTSRFLSSPSSPVSRRQPRYLPVLLPDR
jgi:hypothetical protein